MFLKKLLLLFALFMVVEPLALAKTAKDTTTAHVKKKKKKHKHSKVAGKKKKDTTK